MDKLYLINVFVAVVDANGFAGAARKLNLSAPAVTRAINDLEEQLGVRLLTRTTRVVKLTEAGAGYAEDCRTVLSRLKQADDSVNGLHGSPRGRLTITAPRGFGTLYVTPVVTEYLNLHPEVTVACDFTDRIANLLEENVDVAVRIGELPDSSMQAIRVGSMRLLICASPRYLERHGVPQTPDDLKDHTLIGSGGVTSTSEWRICRDGEPGVVKIQPRMIVTAAETAIMAAQDGFGLTNVLAYKVAEHLRSGRLVTVLGDCETRPAPVHVLHYEGRHASRKARLFIDLIAGRLRADLEAIQRAVSQRPLAEAGRPAPMLNA